MVLCPWVIIVPPDTACAVGIDAGRVREAVVLRIVEDFGHERPGVVQDGSNLHRQPDLSLQDMINTYI